MHQQKGSVMKRLLLLGVLLVLLCSCVTAFADNSIDGTGNQLVQSCNDANAQANNQNWYYCVGYVTGIVNGATFFSADATRFDTKNLPDADLEIHVKAITNMCIPDDVIHKQLGLVVAKYLHDHPEKLNELDVVLIWNALSEAWPCVPPKK